MNANHAAYLIAAVCCTTSLAGCGSSRNPVPTASSAPSGPSALVKFSACMRARGVPDFPDPGTSQGPNAFGVDGYTFNLPVNLSTESPAYQDAYKACGNVIAGPGGGGHGIPARARQLALAHAECMREHGVPDYPDPTFSGNGMSERGGGPGLNPQSPAFQQSQKLCQLR